MDPRDRPEDYEENFYSPIITLKENTQSAPGSRP